MTNVPHTLGHLADALERVAERHAVIDQLHRDTATDAAGTVAGEPFAEAYTAEGGSDDGHGPRG